MINKILITAIAVLTITLILCGIKACNSEGSPVFHFSGKTSNDILYLENQLKKKDKEYSHIIWQLGKRSDSLQKEIDKSKIQLSSTQEKSKQVEKSVKTYSNKVKTSIDTNEKLTACDSLQKLSEIFIATQSDKDSLYNSTINNLEQIVKEKDTALVFCQQYNNSLSDEILKQMEDQKQLQLSLSQCKKETSRRKLLTQILSSAALVLSGITAALLIH